MTYPRITDIRMDVTCGCGATEQFTDLHDGSYQSQACYKCGRGMGVNVFAPTAEWYPGDDSADYDGESS